MIALLAVPVSCDRPAPQVLIRTDLGDMVVELYPDQAPVTTANFLSHVARGHYTNSVFYRTVRMDNQPGNEIKIEVIQGGLFQDDIIDTVPSIIHETTATTGILHSNGIISMARNEPGSASTEFFICFGDQPSLDFGGMRNPDGKGFAAFGRLIRGMDVAREIQALPDKDQYLETQVLIREILILPSS